MATVYEGKETACAKDEALRNLIDGLSSPTSDVTDETSAETAESIEGAEGEGQENGESENGEAGGEESQPAETEVVG